MKKLFLVLLCLLTLGCGNRDTNNTANNEKTKAESKVTFLGLHDTQIDVPEGQKIIKIFRTSNKEAYLTRTRRAGEKAETYILKDVGVVEHTVTFVEH